MKPVEETRLDRLRLLILKHGSAAELNRATGRNERDSTFSQILNGSLNSKTQKPKTMGSDMARQLEACLDLGRGWMDTPIDENQADAPNRSEALRPPAHRTRGIGDVFFQVLDVRAACGDGAFNDDYPVVLSALYMPPQVAQEFVGTMNRSGSVKIVTAAKDSMVPTINPNDLLFVDTSVTEYVGETVYLIVHGGELLCKRLSLAGRDIVVTSDNDKYPQWKWSERPDETRIVGRVLRVLPIQFRSFGELGVRKG